MSHQFSGYFLPYRSIIINYSDMQSVDLFGIHENYLTHITNITTAEQMRMIQMPYIQMILMWNASNTPKLHTRRLWLLLFLLALLLLCLMDQWKFSALTFLFGEMLIKQQREKKTAKISDIKNDERQFHTFDSMSNFSLSVCSKNGAVSISSITIGYS